ncbi:MAG TPA: DegV family protein [Candidatus Limiplasma sp.]|nr:DegV family protein [Candidatus Limiplasma sp.]
MNSYVFFTDSDSDLPYQFVDANDVHMIYMPYVIDGVEYPDDLGRGGKQKEYFERMRGGVAPKTSLLPISAYLEYFEPQLKAGKDILFIAFSSKMSATLVNANKAKEELLQKYPDRKIVIVDTLTISRPMSLLVEKAYALYAEGKSMEEVAQWVEDNRLRAHAWFTVDDLIYLKRGGRISAMAATMGTMLDLKPVLTMCTDGSMTAENKIRGRKSALRYLADKTAENIEDPANQGLIIMHADAEEDAKRLAALIRERVPDIGTINIVFVGPVIGAHCGPGTVASVFLGKPRTLAAGK